MVEEVPVQETQETHELIQETQEIIQETNQVSETPEHTLDVSFESTEILGNPEPKRKPGRPKKTKEEIAEAQGRLD